jgi:diguanylate cyclase (GGDEF)-like protein/PAS domain S-box-containing protein
MSVLDVLRDAAAEFVGAASRNDVTSIVRRAVSRMNVTPEGSGADRAADRQEVTIVLDVLASQASLALERVRLASEIAERGGAQLNALVEQASDVILIIDDENRMRYVSPSARGLLGTSALRGKSLIDLVDPAERRQAEYFLRCVRGAAPGTVGGGRADWTLHCQDDRTVRVEVSCRDLRADESVRGVVVTLRDVTQQRRLEHELTRRLFRDSLTGLPNRLLFDERVSEAIAAGAGVTGILLINLDNFRAINEALGRETGDAVMQAVAGRLRDAAGENHLAARLGGNEFAVLVTNMTGVEILDDLAARLTDALSAPIAIGDDVLSCTGSVGVATTVNADTPDELMRHADLAVGAAKAAGSGNWRRYDPSASTAIGYRLEQRTALSRALRGESLIVEYQPIVALDTGGTVGFEALVRWRHPTRGLLSPGEFIDIAEESGLITPIGERVLAKAAHDAQEWHRIRPDAEPYVSVNVSVRQFRSSGFVEMVQRLLAQADLRPSRLVLEITEGLLLRDDDKVWEDLKTLRQWGIQVAIDDFGTGYSALGYLRQVPLDIVKLDRIFISTITTSSRQRELVRGIVALARTLGLTVVAEGIETERQRDIAAAIGCDCGQGYLFAKSMSHKDAIAWIERAPGSLRLTGRSRGP